jgi:hypothetical protein
MVVNFGSSLGLFLFSAVLWVIISISHVDRSFDIVLFAEIVLLIKIQSLLFSKTSSIAVWYHHFDLQLYVEYMFEWA